MRNDEITGVLPPEIIGIMRNVQTEPFWEAAAQHRLMLPRCVSCLTFRFPPGPFCHVCRAQEVDWQEHDGCGEIYSFTVIRHAVIPDVKAALPLVAAVVELPGTDGVRLIGNVVDCAPEEVSIGRKVELDWYDVRDGDAVPIFRFAGLISLALLVGSLAACSGNTSESDAPNAPALAAARHGDLLRAHEIEAPIPDSRMWDVRYLSTRANGDPIEVSGVVAAPVGPAPQGGRPVVTFAHATTGAADECAPSRHTATDHLWRELGAQLVRAGYVVVATDYQGIGTPGPHPYLVGAAAAHDVLDAARAARSLDAAGASARVVAVGYSQGGHAVLFAGQLASSYAPDVDLVGVVSVAPVIDMNGLMDRAVTNPSFEMFRLFMTTGYEAAYGDMSLGQIFPGEQLEDVGRILDTECAPLPASVIDRTVEKGPGAVPTDLPHWPDRLRENTPTGPIDAPVMVVFGGRDEITPAREASALVNELCGQGGSATLLLDAREFHAESILNHTADVLAWTKEVFGDRPLRDDCPLG